MHGCSPRQERREVAPSLLITLREGLEATLIIMAAGAAIFTALRKGIRPALAVATVGVMVGCTAPTSTPTPAPREQLVLAILPTSTPEVLAAESAELERYLEQRLGANVEIRVPTMYAGVIESLRFGHAQAAFMSAWPAAMARKYAGAELVLAEVREVVIGQDKVEKPYYYSYWVVPKESPYKSLADLRGKKAAFPSPLSTSGYVFPMARMVDLGLVQPSGGEVNPKEFFSDTVFAGGYAQAWEALKKGQVEVTVIAGDVSEKLYREVLAGTRVLEEQGPIPSHGVVFSKDLKEPMRSRLKEALLDLGKPEYRPMMRKFVSAIFVGFQERTADEHLGTLDGSLVTTGLRFTETLR